MLLSVLTLLIGVAHGSEATATLFNEGNAYYRDGNYARALVAYEQAASAGVRNARLHYNLGNAAYKAGKLGRAIVAYERALRLDSNDEDIRANLRFARARAVDRFEDAEEKVITRAALEIYQALPIDGLAILASACLFGLAAAGLTALYFSSWRGIALISGLVCLVLCLLSAGFVSLKASEQARLEAVVIANAVTGRSGPGDDFLQVFTLHEGAKIRVDRSEGRWVQVRLPNGIGGWLPLDAVLRI